MREGHLQQRGSASIKAQNEMIHAAGIEVW